MKVAFFDRDGTIAEDYTDEQWANIDTPILMPYAADVLKHLNDIGYRIIIITNQYLIGENFITQAQYDNYNDSLLSMLESYGISILDVFYCPHARIENCDCCKPKTGLITQATAKYPELDLQNTFIVGDSVCDMQVAEELNIPAYGINIDYNYEKFTKIKNLKELLAILRKKHDQTAVHYYRTLYARMYE